MKLHTTLGKPGSKSNEAEKLNGIRFLNFLYFIQLPNNPSRETLNNIVINISGLEDNKKRLGLISSMCPWLCSRYTINWNIRGEIYGPLLPILCNSWVTLLLFPWPSIYLKTAWIKQEPNTQIDLISLAVKLSGR